MESLIRPTLKFLLFPLLIIAALSSPAELNAAQLNLTWTDNSTNEDGFKIERRTTGSFVQIATVGPNITSYTDSNLTAGSIYCYQVRAFNASGESSFSNNSCATAIENDTDGDGLTDADETNTYGTDPLLADTDGDGLNDGNEVNINGTDPLLADTDGDGVSDGVEINQGSDPLDPTSSVPAKDLLIAGLETTGFARGPLFQIYGLNGTFRVERYVLNPDFTDVSFKQNVRTGGGPERILVCGVETAGSGRGPAIQLYERDGALEFSSFVLSRNFTRLECHTLDKDSDGKDEILVLGQETTGPARGWAVQLYDQRGQLLWGVFVATRNSPNVFIKTSR